MFSVFENSNYKIKTLGIRKATKKHKCLNYLKN